MKLVRELGYFVYLFAKFVIIEFGRKFKRKRRKNKRYPYDNADKH